MAWQHGEDRANSVFAIRGLVISRDVSRNASLSGYSAAPESEKVFEGLCQRDVWFPADLARESRRVAEE